MHHTILDWLAESPVSRASDVVLIPAGITFTLWHDYLKDVSIEAAIMVPILTVVYLFLKIFSLIRFKTDDD